MTEYYADYLAKKSKTAVKILLFYLPILLFQTANKRVVKMYEETLEIRYYFEDTIMQIIRRSLLGITIGVIILLVVLYFLYRKIEKKTMRKILAAYSVLVLVALSGLSVPMNKCYELDGRAMRNVHVLFYCAKDMIEEEYVTFHDEPCEYRYEKSTDIFSSGDTFSYLCLNNRQDVIPIPFEYSSEIKEILKESGNVCDITCYKNSHIIKAINGVELISLR